MSTTAPVTSTPGAPPVSTDCFACRLSGTLTFAGVGVYALTMARRSAKTTLGRVGAVGVGLGCLSIASVRWNMKDAPIDVGKD